MLPEVPLGFSETCNPVMYQHNTLEQIAGMLEKNALSLSAAELVERVKAFCNHVQRESHCDPTQHDMDLPTLETGFHRANDEQHDPSNIFLSVRPQRLNRA